MPGIIPRKFGLSDNFSKYATIFCVAVNLLISSRIAHAQPAQLLEWHLKLLPLVAATASSSSRVNGNHPSTRYTSQMACQGTTGLVRVCQKI